MIPGLENAEFIKYGVMHRNTYINSPDLLDETYNFKKNKNIYFAGQITGVEGYVESISSGLVAALNAANFYEKLLDRDIRQDFLSSNEDFKIVFSKNTVIRFFG